MILEIIQSDWNSGMRTECALLAVVLLESQVL